MGTVCCTRSKKKIRLVPEYPILDVIDYDMKDKKEPALTCEARNVEIFSNAVSFGLEDQYMELKLNLESVKVVEVDKPTPKWCLGV